MHTSYPPEVTDIFDATRSIQQAQDALLRLNLLVDMSRSRHRAEMTNIVMEALCAQQAALSEASRAGLRLCRRPSAPVLRLVPKETAQL